MANQKHDQQEFDRYLQGSSPLSTTYQHNDAGGPTELTDARILAAAKSAVNKPSTGSPFGGYQRMVPTSIAALFMLTLAAVFIHDQFPSTPLQPAPVLSSAPTSSPEDHAAAVVGQTALNESVSTSKPQPASAPLELARVDSQTRAAPDPVTASKAASPAPLKEPMHRLQQDTANAYADTSAGARGKPEKAEQYKEKGLAAIEESKTARLSDKIVATKVRSADNWLTDIAARLKNQQIKQAKVELQAFRKNYPHHVIDPKRFPEIIRLLAELEPGSPSP